MCSNLREAIRIYLWSVVMPNVHCNDPKWIYLFYSTITIAPIPQMRSDNGSATLILYMCLGIEIIHHRIKFDTVQWPSKIHHQWISSIHPQNIVCVIRSSSSFAARMETIEITVQCLGSMKDSANENMHNIYGKKNLCLCLCMSKASRYKFRAERAH